MDASMFSESMEEFYADLGDNLSETGFEVQNCYLSNRPGSVYLHLTIKRNGLKSNKIKPEGTELSRSMEFVISYDNFYRVPVLHFRDNGKIDSSGVYASLDIHPILQSPFAMLHPCETDAFMKTTHLEGSSYLLFWFNISMSILKTGIQLRP